MLVVNPFNILGVSILKPKIHADERGRIISVYDYDQLRELCGLEDPFIHSDVYHLVARGLVGLYYQERNPRASIHHCVAGRAQVVAVDLREGSRTFGKFVQTIIDSYTCFGFFTPRGFATGCIGIGGGTVVVSEHTTRHDITDQKVLKWDDSTVGVNWGSMGGTPLLGQRERAGVALNVIQPYKG
jgi:dTDP-4-dehydrorhamnose 3,5-epimerase